MAYTLEATIQRFRGLSSDIKPGATDGVPVGSTFRETDTGHEFIWRGSQEGWVRQEDSLAEALSGMAATQVDILNELKRIRIGHELIEWEQEVKI